MKRFAIVVTLLLACLPMAFAGDIVTQDAMRLPLVARNFIMRHFSSQKISYIKIEDEPFKPKRYEVLLTDRTEIDFDGNGNWKEVDCKKNPVPAAILPPFVKRYLEDVFPDAFVTQIELDGRETEVELNNDISLTFNRKGELVDFDD